MENKTVNERVSYLIKLLNLNTNSFANSIDIHSSILYNIEKGRNKPSFDVIEKILKIHSVDANWLIQGIGSVFIDEVTDLSSDNLPKELVIHLSGLDTKSKALGYYKTLSNATLKIFSKWLEDELQELYEANIRLNEAMIKLPHPNKDEYYLSKFKEWPAFRQYLKDFKEEFSDTYEGISEINVSRVLYIIELETLISHYQKALIKTVNYAHRFISEFNIKE
jgi:transcriptional regulator with XRE-family HTH domain